MAKRRADKDADRALADRDFYDIERRMHEELAKSMREAQDRQAWEALMRTRIPKPRTGSEWVLIGPCVCTKETEKALYVKRDMHDYQWIPKSQLHPTENEIEHEGDQGMLVVPEWLAKEKGWL